MQIVNFKQFLGFSTVFLFPQDLASLIVLVRSYMLPLYLIYHLYSNLLLHSVGFQKCRSVSLPDFCHSNSVTEHQNRLMCSSVLILPTTVECFNVGR
jgi:hypothetical protein